MVLQVVMLAFYSTSLLSLLPSCGQGMSWLVQLTYRQPSSTVESTIDIP